MTLILAPVSFPKSGARRCRGSAICGPVKVTRFTVTPAKGFAPAAEVPALLVPAAATTSNATMRSASDPSRFIALDLASKKDRMFEYGTRQTAGQDSEFCLDRSDVSRSALLNLILEE